MSDGLLGKISALEKSRDEITELVQAICRVVGGDEVMAKVAELRREKMVGLIKAAVKDGRIRASKVVTPASMVVGIQEDKKGNQIFPGRFQLFLDEIQEDIRTQLVGLTPGTTFDLKDGSKLHVVEVYDKMTAVDKAVAEVARELDKVTAPAKPKKAPRKKR